MKVRVWACLLALLTAWPARAGDLYLLDQTHGSIVFSVDHFGLFTSHGTFPRFQGRLDIDRAHPERTTIDVSADAAAISIPWAEGVALLRSPAFFDTARYPAVHFVSASISGLDPRHFRINGTLEIRGVQRPMTLDATLERRALDPVSGVEIADFAVTGILSRSGFGMTSEPIMISDQVRLSIAARIALPAQPK